MDEPFGEPDHAELEALCGTERRAGAMRDLDAAPADIHDHRRRRRNIDTVDRSEMDEACFFGTRNHLRLDTCFALDGCKEFSAVFGFAHRAGGRCEYFFDLVRLGQSRKSGKRLQRRSHRFGSQRLAVESPRAEADHFFFPVDDFK